MACRPTLKSASGPAVIAAAAAAALEVSEVGQQAAVYLHATPEVLADRLRAASDGHRPLLDTGIDAVLVSQYELRDPVYRAIARFVADAMQTPVAIAEEITQWLETART